MRTATLPPVEKLDTDLDPAFHRLFFDRSPAATKEWIETFLTIPDLNANIVPFKLFPQQDLMLLDATGRDLTVKGRQSRTSSLEMAVTVHEFTTTWGYTALTGAHDDATTEFFRQRIKHHLRDLKAKGLDYKLTVDNDNEMVIGGLDSRIIFQSGEKRIIGRSFTAHRVHFSEIAHWRPETVGPLVGGLKPSVPGPPNGSIVFESTPKGAEGLFYNEIMDAQPFNPSSLWTVHFYPWWIEPRYRVGSDPEANIVLPAVEFQELLSSFRPSPEENRLIQKSDLRPDQILWRRFTMTEMAKTTTPFLQEFPESLDGCFVSVSGNYFITADGIDHLEWYRSLITPPSLEMDNLQYNKTRVELGAERLAVYEFPDPAQAYVVYVDAASGELGDRTDFTAINVLNATTHHKVARFRAKIPRREAAIIAAAIGELYGNALLGVESGGYGSEVLARLQELLYPNLYYHYDPEQPKKAPKAGIYPTALIRKKILENYRSEVVSHSYVTRDALEVQEMGTFDWTKVQDRMKVQAAVRGSHDDILISVAGCLFIAPEAVTRHKSRRRTEEETILVGRHGLIIGREKATRRGPQPWMT